MPEAGEAYLSPSTNAVQICTGGVHRPRLVVRRKRWRAEKGKPYYFAYNLRVATEDLDVGHAIDDAIWISGNYWKTREEAERFSEACSDLAIKMQEEANGDR